MESPDGLTWVLCGGDNGGNMEGNVAGGDNKMHSEIIPGGQTVVPNTCRFDFYPIYHYSLWQTQCRPLPRRIIEQHCRRRTIYWHFASLNSAVTLPESIHFKQYMCASHGPTHRLWQLLPSIHT